MKSKKDEKELNLIWSHRTKHNEAEMMAKQKCKMQVHIQVVKQEKVFFQREISAFKVSFRGHLRLINALEVALVITEDSTKALHSTEWTKTSCLLDKLKQILCSSESLLAAGSSIYTPYRKIYIKATRNQKLSELLICL